MACLFGTRSRTPCCEADCRGCHPGRCGTASCGATGLSQSSIRQIERAKQAAILLRQGIPISDTVHEVGYFDQPHLTRSFKKWIGHTPAQILRSGGPR